MKKELLLKWLPYGVALVAFLLFAVIYCYPIIEGKVIQQSDTLSWKSMYNEAKTHLEETGEPSYWSGSMFSGMPTYQTGGGKIPSMTLAKPFGITKLFTSGPIAILISYLIGFFILLRAFKVNPWLSIFGAMAIALSSYFFIIIEAGHVTKAFTIGNMAAVIGGFHLIFRKKYWIGASIVMIFAISGMMSHPQMTYYIFMLIGVLYFAELYTHIREKKWKDLGIGTAIFAISILVSIGAGFPKMQLNREYVKETMRGGHSELEKHNDGENKTEGLDLDYATAWSYGISETTTLLIPNFMGGSSHYDLGTNSDVYKTMVGNGVPKKQAADISSSLPMYWGDQPFTSGPVYVGAIICFLFVLGLIIVRGPYKWALLAATLFSMALAWGKNFMPFTELFFEYFPMYNKFRAVSSILIVAEITIPLLGFLALKAIFNKEVEKSTIMKGLYLSTGIVGGICLMVATVGSGFNFVSPNDAQLEGAFPEWLITAIQDERASMLIADAIRSFIFVLLGAGTLWLLVNDKIKQAAFIPIIGMLLVVDLWSVDKRHFNNDAFVSERSYNSYFKKQPWEKMLEADTDPHFRIINLTTNTFNDSRSSHYYKSIGGYHAAKLRRYQDLIDQHIAKNNMAVLDMLNTKYFIVQAQDGQAMPQMNPNAMGNAWFIDSLILVNTPNEECDALNTVNLRNSAIVDQTKFGEFAKNFVPGHDSTAQINFLTYAPGKQTYEYSAEKAGTIVFSEIYYPYGWHASIDGEPIEHYRVNYALRALNVPAGKHNITFEMYPETLTKSEPVAYASFAIVYCTIFFGIGYAIWQRKKKKNEIVETNSSNN